MGSRLFSVHGNNFPNLTGDDLDEIQKVNPGFLLVTQPDFGTIPEIRRRMPDITIIGRIFGDYALGFDAWHLPTDPSKLIDYGRFCGRQAEQWGLDILQYRNEPGIDDDDPSWWTVDGYKRLARESGFIRAGFRQTTNRKLGTVPLSPGHQEDDGLLGAQYLAEEWHKHDVLLLHTYWNRDPSSVESEWYGQRYKRQLDAYGWTDLWAITEWNRDEPTPPGDEERKSLAADARRWFSLFPYDSTFLGAAFFIWRTGDPKFQRLQMYNNDELKPVANEVNQNQGGSTVPKVTKIEPILTPAGHPGGDAVLTMRVSGVDGYAKGFVDVAHQLLPGSTEVRYGGNMTTEVGPFTDGNQTFRVKIGPATTPITSTTNGAYTFRIFETDGQAVDLGAFGPFPIEITPQSQESPSQPKPANPPTSETTTSWENSPNLGVMTAYYNAAHALESNSDPKVAEIGRRSIALLDWWKAGAGGVDPFSSARKP